MELRVGKVKDFEEETKKQRQFEYTVAGARPVVSLTSGRLVGEA